MRFGFHISPDTRVGEYDGDEIAVDGGDGTLVLALQPKAFASAKCGLSPDTSLEGARARRAAQPLAHSGC